MLRLRRRLMRCGRQAKDFTSARQGGVDMRTDIFVADALEESGFFHDEQRLRVRRAEDQMFSFSPQPFVKIFERIQSGSVHRQNLSHSKDENVRFLFESCERTFQFVGCAEEKGSENAIDHDAFGDLFSDE